MKRGASGIDALLGLDKPAGLTSHDCVFRIRQILGESRVGHAGTLDPAATGVLVVGVGQATRLCGLLASSSKVYEARIIFGSETNTDDAEGELSLTAEVQPRLAEQGVASAVAASLVGEQDQVPPAFSAISVGGRRAYKAARSGESLELAARRITIYGSELIHSGVSDGAVFWDLRLDVSKGTYIRAIARDLGRSLGTAAHLGALRRISSGKVGIEECVSLEELEQLRDEGNLEKAWIDPVHAAGIGVLPISERELDDVACGRAIKAQASSDERVCLTHAGQLMGIWRRDGDRYVSEASFPRGIVGVQ